MTATNQSYLPELELEQVVDAAQAINRQITVLETHLEMQAKQLVATFIDQRSQIQKAMNEPTTRDEFKDRFAPLVLSSRVHKGSLEITWSLQKGRTKPNAAGKTKGIFKHVAKGRRSGYKIPTLMSLSRDYELMLVVEAERKAAAIREAWSKVVALRVAARTVKRIGGEDQNQDAPAVDAALPTGLPTAGSPRGPSEKMVDTESAVLNLEFPKNDLGVPGRGLYD